jgi:microcin C transport system ATP-binding protein
VEGIDIMLREGETVGVVGESGSGKTTLGRAILRLVGSKGHIIFDGDKISELSMDQIRPLRRQMQIVFQDPMSSLSPRRTVEQIVGEGLAINKIGQPGKERTRLINEALLEVNIDPDTRHRYPHEFSGGQRQRIAIARVLVLKPRFIVLDEPTSSLDRSTQSQIIDLLRFLQTRHRLAYLFISHDLTVVKAIAHKVIVIKDGRLVEANTTEEIFERPKDPYTRELLKAALELEIVHE